MSLVNITYILPNVIVVLSISSATKEHTGYYSCRTEPPNVKSHDFLIQISGKVLMNSDKRDLLKLHFSFISGSTTEHDILFHGVTSNETSVLSLVSQLSANHMLPAS